MGNSYSIKDHELQDTPNEIYLHDKTYVFNKNYTINVKKDMVRGKKRYIFYEKVNNIYFLMFKPLPECKEVYLCDMRNRPVLNMKDNTERKSTKIFIKEDNVKFRVKIRLAPDRVKVYFVNKANGKKEILQIKSNKKFTQVGVYYGALEDNPPLIAKFYIKDKDRDLQVTKEYNYIYEIAAGVDISFMAMLAIYINRYRIHLAGKTSIYSSKELGSHSRRTCNSSRNSSSNGSKNSKISWKDVKISNFSTNSPTDIGMIEDYYSLPRVDNEYSPSLNSNKTISVEY